MSKEVFYSTHWSRGLPEDRIVSHLLRVTRGAQARAMLDIGCGDTDPLPSYCERRVVHGADISAKAIEMAGQSGIEGHVLDLDEELFPFSDAAFDAVMAGAII